MVLDALQTFPWKMLGTPLVLCWFACALLTVLQWRQQSATRWLQLLLLCGFSVASCKPLQDTLALTLEQSYPPLNHPNPTLAVSHIFVLGCQHSDQDQLPITSQLAECSLARLSEGIRLWHQQPHAVLHLSGHLAAKRQPHTKIAEQYALAMGVSAEKIRLHPAPSNTQQETAVLIRELPNEPVAVVTSAMHMPRTMRWLQHYADPARMQTLYAAPTDHQNTRREDATYPLYLWLPSLSALQSFYYLQYESMALLVQRWQLHTATADAPASVN